ncbi:MAG TPA: NAD(+) synthase, partial [Chthonomonadales bacterium]|nr:NAD(+) synthase [Chthonomonadales bacterium]
VAVFPELSLSAYSNDDLFQQQALLQGVLDALGRLVESSRDLAPVLLIGAPLVFEDRLYNCAVAIYRGEILGVTPKSYLPNYREFYEKRQFSAAREAIAEEVLLLGKQVPFGVNLIYNAANMPGFALNVEICEDVWVPVPPSSYAAMAGATILANLSASNITVAKADYRRSLCALQSARCIAGYIYSAAGPGESTTDLAWDGQALIYENYEKLAESTRFAMEPQVVAADIDLERLSQERLRMSSFHDAVCDHRSLLKGFRHIRFEFQVPGNVRDLMRPLERFPYVPSDPKLLDERCYEAYNIQVQGLVKRLQSTGISRVVIGISGGLDSTHALIVTARALDLMGLPRRNIHAFTMPGFATSESTLRNARSLMAQFGASGQEIDIRPSCTLMLTDIGHGFPKGEERFDITFENVQAGERTSHLFRLANQLNALVVGTGDLSELALGWCTYGVGDQMSHYNVNASVPKTLIRHLIRWVVRSRQFDSATGKTLKAVLDTVVSPELIPHKEGRSEEPAQVTEEIIGPYDLQDFHLYFISRYGFRPSKVAFLSHQAWRDRAAGVWPEMMPQELRNQYDIGAIKRWLQVFLYRFFQTSQFKRSALPNGPKVGSGGSLSPRGDWRAPSDSDAEVWLEELRSAVPDL